jgi:hypothetical protein
MSAGSDATQPARDTERHSRLLGVALGAVVLDHVGDSAGPVGDPAPFPRGAALMHGVDAWVLLDDDAERRLGSALAWALRAGARALHVVARDGGGVLARRAHEFSFPTSVWALDGRSIERAEPQPLGPPDPPPAAHLALMDLIERAGASPVVEHGIVMGEVRGLEVCRVVDDRHTGAVRLEVGVGAHDREAFTMIYGDVPELPALRGVVDAVLEHRVPGSVRHPLSRLAPERLLRWRLLQDGAPVGAVELVPAEPPMPRRNLSEVVACTATGTGVDGSAMVVVCSSAVDLDVIPYAVDARLAASGAPGVAGGGLEPRLVVVMPERDLVPLTMELAGLVRAPLDTVAFD